MILHAMASIAAEAEADANALRMRCNFSCPFMLIKPELQWVLELGGEIYDYITMTLFFHLD